MGQVLPLPERIPTPTVEQEQQLKALGFEFGTTRDVPNASYIELILAPGYRWHDNSWRADLPVWYILNAQNLAVACVQGAWKGAYDNKLNLFVYEEPKQIEFRNTVPISSETSPAALLGEAVVAGMHNIPEGSAMLSAAVEEYTKH